MREGNGATNSPLIHPPMQTCLVVYDDDDDDFTSCHEPKVTLGRRSDTYRVIFLTGPP